MKILVTDHIAEEGIAALRSYAAVDVRLHLSPRDLVDAIGDYEALVVRSDTKVTEEVIEAGKKLQVVGRAGVGVDNIDLAAATKRGIVVVNSPAGNIVSTAEHTIAMLLALCRHIPQANERLRKGNCRRQDYMGTEVRGKTMGIVGLGRVGSEVARRARGLEMKVVAYDPFVPADHARNLGVTLVSKNDLVRESDFIALHTPLTESTRNFIGVAELQQVKPTVRILNTARGGLIDEEALYRALTEGRVAGAAIDVFAAEPAESSPLLKLDKVIATPHLGASTNEAQASVAVNVAEQVLAILQGRPARYAVNAPLIPPETVSVLAPFLEVAGHIGRLVSQLAEGQLAVISIRYEGEIALHDTTALKAATLGGVLERVTEERVNLVNADVVAQSRGLKVVEQKNTLCENYGNLITVEVITSVSGTVVAGTVLRDQTHIVRIDDYWIDIVPTGGYWLFSDHRDRPGLIGAVGTVTGDADINISSMQVSRRQARGQALMVLALDEPLSEEARQRILAIPDVSTVKVVKL